MKQLLFSFFNHRFLVLILLVACSSSMSISYARNTGHRMGAGKKEIHKNLPENSLSALAAALTNYQGQSPIQFRKDFRYLEFDVQETADGKVVIFHDKELSRMLPYTENKRQAQRLLSNRDVIKRAGMKNLTYKKLRIKHLTLKQLHTLNLKGTKEEKVPTLGQTFYLAQKLKLKKPIAVDIKYFHSAAAHRDLIQKVALFRDNYLNHINLKFESGYDMDSSGANFLSLLSRFRDFGPAWCPQFRSHGFSRVFRAMRHSTNLCKGY